MNVEEFNANLDFVIIHQRINIPQAKGFDLD